MTLFEAHKTLSEGGWRTLISKAIYNQRVSLMVHKDINKTVYEILYLKGYRKNFIDII